MSLVKESTNNTLNSINPDFLYNYLLEKGWKEEEKIDDRACILSISLDEKKYSLLLPIDNKMSDYAYRILDVLRILEIVEKRSQSELIKVFINAQSLVKEKQCEILTLRFKFKYQPEQTYFSAKIMGEFLSNLQDFCEATATHHEGKQKMSKEIKELSEIFVFDTFQGSFGIKVNFTPEKQLKKQLSLFTLAEKVSRTFLDLIKFSNESDKENLKILLKELNSKSAKLYRKFLMSLQQSEANFYANWGSVNPNGGGSAKLDYEQILSTVAFINNMELEEAEENEIIGELIYFSKKKKRLGFEDLDDNQEFSIDLSDKLYRSIKNKLKLIEGKLYTVKFKEITSINSSTGEEKIERTLIDLDYYNADNDSSLDDLI